MRFIVFTSLLSLVAAAPVQDEKRQTDAPVSLGFTGGAPPVGFPTGAFPPGESFTGSFVRPTGSFSHRPHGTGSFVRPTGSFTGTFVRPTGTFVRPTGTPGVRPTGARTGVHTPHGTYAPPMPTTLAIVGRQDAPTAEAHPRGSHTGSFTPHVRPTGTGTFEMPSFTGTFARPTGTPRVRPTGTARVRPTGTRVRPSGSFTGSFVRPTGTFERPTGSFTGTFVRPTGTPGVRPTGTRVRPSGSARVRPTGTAAVAPAAPSAEVDDSELDLTEDPSDV